MPTPRDIPPREQRDLLKSSPRTRERARDLRSNMSKPEAWLWTRLRRSQTGFLFHRQKPLGPFIADFYCHEARPVVETDGACHDRSAEYDRSRDAWMLERGIYVQRIPASAVFEDLDGVVRFIHRRCKEQAAVWAQRKTIRTSPGVAEPPPPPPQARRGMKAGPSA